MTEQYRAKKIGGSYEAVGTVLGTFHTTDGAERCVFEFDTPHGLLHIFNMRQVLRLTPDETITADDERRANIHA